MKLTLRLLRLLKLRLYLLRLRELLSRGRETSKT